MRDRSATPPVIVITGPTASGKSGLATALAERTGGVVINADSMQVYRELPVLTAQPDAGDRARAPHGLYGVRPAADPCSAEKWRALALREIAVAHAHGKLPILVGGTGLYLRALVRGFAPIPDVPDAVRQTVRSQQRDRAPSDFHALLAAEDPAMADRLNVGDTQRIARALEVVRATGRSLSDFQAMADTGGAPFPMLAIAAIPEKAALDDAIAARFDRMLHAGALDEVRALARQGLDPRLPAMRAVGVPHLLAHVRGELDLDTARERAIRDTRRYAKRQRTWLRTQTPRDFRRPAIFRKRFTADDLDAVFTRVRAFLNGG